MKLDTSAMFSAARRKRVFAGAPRANGSREEGTRPRLPIARMDLEEEGVCRGAGAYDQIIG